nr:immunoglobulin light chain junction region [Macaca mulatta]MOV67763.1 immunoglobulin light chain junction region [Macaca mulatta]MOV68565.1 immunoglobulin light chain junction region [Macaca mulatta]MOV69358.1 immunoglobulin light chain junction region [Macaca mulatta]MOV69608.1 immunoglobulin light chain junction region [Macaca mulatta]
DYYCQSYDRSLNAVLF